MTSVRTWLNLVGDFIFPPTCPGCGSERHYSGEWCQDCFEAVLDVRRMPDVDERLFAEVWALGHYDGGLKVLLRDIKFNGKKERSRGAAPFLASYNFYMKYNESNIVNSNCKIMYDYIVPVPSSEKKKAKRGYNQVDLFFLEWAHSLWEIDRKNFKWLDCIYKFDTSRDMWGLTNKERHQNIDDAFVICADYKDIDFTNKNILIVDDIYTTGATIEAVAKVLQKHKALRIDALTLASGSF